MQAEEQIALRREQVQMAEAMSLSQQVACVVLLVTPSRCCRLIDACTAAALQLLLSFNCSYCNYNSN